jgi:hypothetical protein
MTTNYYFFTDANQQGSNPSHYIKTQTSTEAYGPVTIGVAAGMDEYRVTSLHSATFDPAAYAACDAIVCVQRVNATVVNIILKPLAQPPLNFVPIKYIVYKGILASSLINGTEVAAPANNQLAKFIWDEQVKKNASAGTTANPPAAALGIGLTGSNLADTDPIDNLFYRVGVTFQLPVVKGGWSIGQFDKTGFGMEVLMDGLGFHHALLLARRLENKIAVAALTGNETDAQQFDHWHAKEQVLGFMDPCAFYGSFFLAGIQAKTSGNSPFVAKSGNELYRDVLFAFLNRNTAYLDIRNEHNFYFNYFNNYIDIIKIGNPPGLVDYYESKWPLLMLTAANLPPGNKTKARNAFQLHLPEGDNPKPLVYVSQGYRDINRKRDGFPAELKSADRFFDAFLAPVNGYTATKNASGPSSLTFVVPNVTGQGDTTPVSCYIRLKYLKQQQGATVEPRVIKSDYFLDNLLYPLDLRIPFGGTARIKSFVYEEEVYVNAQDVVGLGFDGIAKVGIARDDNNTSVFLAPACIRTQEGPASALVTLSGETSDYASHYPNFVALKYPLEKVEATKPVLSTAGQVPVAKFVSDGNVATQERFDVPDFDKFFVIVIANSTYDAWKTMAAAPAAVLDSRFRVYLGMKNVLVQTDSAGIAYTAIDLVLRGFALDTSTGRYMVQEMNTDPTGAANVKVYTHASP